MSKKQTKATNATATKTPKAARGQRKPTEASKPTTGKGKTPGAKPAKKISALDAAATVLAESGQAMNAVEIVTAMSEKGLWTSKAGKTPHATIYSAILREIGTNGQDARFARADGAKGKFTAKK